MIFRRFIIFAILILYFGSFPKPARAEDGLPGSPSFGYGACLDLEGYHAATSIQAANIFGLDWITIEYSWSRYWQQPESSPNWHTLDQVMSQISTTPLAVMISITEPPAWAIEATGPNIQHTTDLVLDLARRYPNNILAIELFPGANTHYGWGTTPNSHAYSEMLQTVQIALDNEGFGHTIIAAGIDPSVNKQEALSYLNNLLASSTGPHIPVVSLYLPSIPYAPETQPETVNGHTLRFYEEARQVMLNNGQQNSLIWISRFEQGAGQELETNWLLQAYLTVRPQLYIGMASYYCLNNPLASNNLISPDGSPSEAFESLAMLIAAGDSYHSITEIIGNGMSAQP